MGKVARSFNGFPPSVSLNTQDHCSGMSRVSAWNHRSFLTAKIQKIFELSIGFEKINAVS